MASIRERKGRWQARVTRHGFLPETKSFDTHEGAVKWARAIEAEIDKGVFVSLKEAERTTLKDVLLRYAEEVSPGKRSGGKDNIAKLSFLARQRFAGLSLANLTPKAVAQFRDERLSIHGNIINKASAKTIGLKVTDERAYMHFFHMTGTFSVLVSLGTDEPFPISIEQGSPGGVGRVLDENIAHGIVAILSDKRVLKYLAQ